MHPGATFFIWEGEPLPEHIEALKGLGLTSLVVSPCGNRPDGGDFLTAGQSAALNEMAGGDWRTVFVVIGRATYPDDPTRGRLHLVPALKPGVGPVTP